MKISPRKNLSVLSVCCFLVLLLIHGIAWAETDFELLMPLASKGNAEAQYKIGLMYDQGKGVEQDRAKAIVWFYKAGKAGNQQVFSRMLKEAEQGKSDAQLVVGMSYIFAKKDQKNGLLWLFKSAEAGYAEAIDILARSIKVPEVLNWFVEQSDKGNATAAYMLGEGYCDEYLSCKGNAPAIQSLPKDNKKSYKFLVKAAENGHEKAFELLAEHCDLRQKRSTSFLCTDDRLFPLLVKKAVLPEKEYKWQRKVALEALEYLAKNGDEKSLKALGSLVTKENRDALLILERVAATNTAALEILVSIVESGGDRYVWQSINTLASNGDKKALAAITKAAVGGDKNCIDDLSYLAKRGNKQALIELQQVASAGNTQAQLNLADLFYEDYKKIEMGQDKKKGLYWVVTACDSKDEKLADSALLKLKTWAGKGDEKALSALIEMAKKKKWHERVVSWLRDLAKDGNKKPAEGVASHTNEKDLLLEKATLGYGDAQYELGLLCYAEGTSQGREEGLRWIIKKATGPDDYEARTWLVKRSEEGHADAFNGLIQVASQGYTRAQAELGKLYYEGKGIEKDREKGIEWLNKSFAATDDSTSKSTCRWLFGLARGDKDAKDAFAYLVQLATQGKPCAQYELGRIYYEGDGAQKDKEKGLGLIRESAAGGNRDAISWLENKEKNIAGEKEKLKTLEQEASQGQAESQAKLGMIYFNGESVTQDKKKAYEWLVAACSSPSSTLYSCKEDLLGKEAKKGDSNALHALAKIVRECSVEDVCQEVIHSLHDMAYKGNDVALKPIVQKAKDGNRHAIIELSHLFRDHTEEDPSSVYGLENLKKAALFGYAEAQYRLGLWYYEGENINNRDVKLQQDKQKGIEWLQKASDQGHAEARKFLLANNQLQIKKVMQAGYAAEEKKPWRTFSGDTITSGEQSKVGILSMWTPSPGDELDGASCTATLIGPQHILTAGHCVVSPLTGKIFEQISFTPGANNSNSKVRYLMPKAAGKRVYLLKDYVEYAKNDKEHNRQGRVSYSEVVDRSFGDYAIVELTRPIGQEIGWLEMEFRDDLKNNDQVPIRIAGYPGDEQHGLMRETECQDAQVVFGPSGSSYLITGECKIWSGMSGSAVRAKLANGREKIIGIISRSRHNKKKDGNIFSFTIFIDRFVFATLRAWQSHDFTSREAKLINLADKTLVVDLPEPRAFSFK